jgi:phosphoserine aminotransferase
VTTLPRIFSFRPGPAMLPAAVVERVDRDLVSFPGLGLSALEINHRTDAYGAIAEATEAGIRRLARIPPHYRVLFLPGGASLQFSMLPMNLLPPGATADYVDTGLWAKNAIEEAAKLGTVHVAASTASALAARIPLQDELRLTAGAAYVHITSNNTDVGTQWKAAPLVGDVPLACDATSDIFSGPLDLERYALVYASAQKNLGLAGVTLVIIREDLLGRSSPLLPKMLSYRVHADFKSLFNTPPIFPVYVLGLMIDWLLDRGGLDAIGVVNARKAARLYAEIDRTGFYQGLAQLESRSTMNATFRLRNSDLEQRFIARASDEGLDGLAGDPTVGRIRASIYNACPDEAVDALVQFMCEFERTHG